MSDAEVEALRAALERAERRLDRERRIRIESEAIAEQVTARLYEADRLKSVFLSSVHHELRTPLTTIIGFAEVLLKSWPDLDESTRVSAIDRIAANASRLRILIEDLLEFAQVERSPDLQVGRFDLAAVASGALDRFDQADLHHVLVRDLTPVFVTGDEVAVAKVVTNLVDNALAYGPPDTAITVTVGEAAGVARLEVVDEGTGVPADERQLVFERFYRGSQAEVLKTPGTGLGLAFVREVVARLGGRATVDGSRFTVTLPLAGNAV